MRRIFVLVSLFLLSVSLHSQEFGGHPPSVKWKQVNTDVARVIFPSGLDSAGRHVADVVALFDKYTYASIGITRRKVNIVLQPSTTISNAYVALGPFRSEFQLTPRQNSFELGSLPWLDNLAIHEYRHVQQYNNFNRGFSKVFRVFFGEEGQALANALVVPDWFFEGDAVYQETKVSQQGRGRLPYFFNDYRSLWESGKNYSWMKLRNGSLRDFVPDHYRLGYLLTAYGYEKYGNEFWKTVSSDAAAFKGLFYPWQKSIERQTGKSYQQFRNEALDFFKKQARVMPGSMQSANTNGDKQSDVSGNDTRRKHFISDQEHPYITTDGSLVYMETGYKRRPHFVIQKNDGKEVIRTRDISLDNCFSLRNNTIVYAAYRPDTRWGWRDYSDLRILDIQTGKQRRLTNRTKYFSPDISEDGKTVVAVHVDEKGQNELHLLNASTGNREHVVPNTDGLFFTYPKFYDADRVVSAVRDREGKMSVAITDTRSGKNDYLLPFTWNVTGFPWIESDTIFFTASSGRSDQLFAWHKGSLYRAENGQHELGNYQLNTNKGRYVWTRFTSQGFRLMESRNVLADNRRISPALTGPDANSVFGVNAINSDTSGMLASVRPSQYNVTTYPKSFRLFNFHSRRPYISDPDYSFSFVSQNILNTVQSELTFNYNRNEKYKEVGFNVIYGGLYPLLRAGVNYTFDRRSAVRNRTQLAFWDEAEARAGVSVPLNLTRGRTFTYLTVGTDYVHNKRFFKGYFKDTFENRAFGYISSSVNFSNQVQQMRQQIYPKFAQTLLVSYRRAVTELEGNQLLASGSAYLPGIAPTHSFVLQVAFQRRDTLRNINFSNNFPFSRGYAVPNFHLMTKVGANYHFPLVYPDWGFANLVYFLRIRSNVFYDVTRISEYNRNRTLVDLDFRSYGTEIFFDTKWWNQLPLSFGFRFSRLMDPDIEGRGENWFEFILPVNILSR